MRALFRRFRSATDVTFDEVRGEACDTSCRVSAAVDRARIATLLFR
ncbi:hypothetical protein FHR32_006246 [Streptosporangium album]|uniref:Uncharacterized protein n=1 Tax=Streptosporangium album TaxID=47479 RepID=A0A7W7S0V6_9ACTN|nr:hypothetical protein [Streptosporangium album]MBB4941860.1 hypothetical protein [Streptosporangium album]